MNFESGLGYGLIFTKIAPVFILIGIGFAMRRVRWLSAEADHSLMQVIVNLLYPALILQFVLGNPALTALADLWLPPTVGFLTILLGLSAGYAVSRLLRKNHPRMLPTFAFTTGIHNYGYIPVPIVLALFSGAGDHAVGILFLHNVGVEAAVWTLGVATLTAGSGEVAWKRIFNPPVLTMIVALGLNLSGTASYVPGYVLDVISWLAPCAIPLGIILAGATLADLLKEHGAALRPLSTSGFACALRLGLLPIVFLLLARFLPGASDDLRRVIIIQAAMPAGMFPLVMTRYYGGDTRTAAQVILATTIVGLFTIPLWIQFGLSWVF